MEGNMSRCWLPKTWWATSSANLRLLVRFAGMPPIGRRGNRLAGAILMQVSATLRFARLSPQKARLVADQLRGLPVEQAVETLAFSKPRAAWVLKKVLESAIANAEHNEGADIDELRVGLVQVDQGPTFRRYRARARGRASKITKRTSHITLTVTDQRR